MNIAINQFCYLSSAPAWLAWLHDFSKEMYADFVEHGRRNQSCRSNQQKMLEVLDAITKTDGGEQRLEEFLRKSFPHVLAKAIVRETAPSPAAGGGPVFPHYDPQLMTLPRRRVITTAEANGDLEAAVRDFLRDKPLSDYVIVDGVAYVEYLPASLAPMAGQVPADNWQVRAYKQVHPSSS